VRHRNDAAPALRERESSDQGRDVFATRPTATFEDQSATIKRPCPDCRSSGSARCPSESRGVHRDSVEFGQRTTNRKRELRTGTKAGVRRQGTMHAHPGATHGARSDLGQDAASKFGGAIGIFASNLQRWSQRRGYDERGCGRCRADTPEPSSEITTEVQGSKMQAR
jgi:hypothetical protein